MAKHTESQARGMDDMTRSGPPQNLSESTRVDGVLPRFPKHTMSGYDVPLTARRIRTGLRWSKVSIPKYLEWTGGQSPEEFIADNPTWTARAFEVLLLENLATIRG